MRPTSHATRWLRRSLMACAAVFAGARAVQTQASAPTQFTSEVDRVSYTIGVQFANSVKADGVTLNVGAFAQALTDVLGDRPLAMSESEMVDTMHKFSRDLTARKQAAQAAQAQAQLAESEQALATIAAQEGVQVLPSGLHYVVLTAGGGASPGATDTVRVHYRGTLLDGTEFDNSYSRGTPAEFPVNRVIAGWTEALQLMPMGAKWKLWIPGNLAYGPAGRPPAIPPNAILVFEVELLGIVGE